MTACTTDLATNKSPPISSIHCLLISTSSRPLIPPIVTGSIPVTHRETRLSTLSYGHIETVAWILDKDQQANLDEYSHTMYDERENPSLPEHHTTEEKPPVENAGIKVYDRPERRAIPVWLWLVGLLALALVGWLVLQSLS
jgi:hypothetical protein